MRIGWEHKVEAAVILDASPKKKGANDVLFTKYSRTTEYELAVDLSMIWQTRWQCWCRSADEDAAFSIRRGWISAGVVDLSTCMALASVRCCSRDTFDCRAAIWATTYLLRNTDTAMMYADREEALDIDDHEVSETWQLGSSVRLSQALPCVGLPRLECHDADR